VVHIIKYLNQWCTAIKC